VSEYLLKVTDLKKHFPIRGGILGRQIAKVHAVDGVSFQMRPGETVGLVGESGCGKSTLGRAILRLHEPTSGSVMFDGQEITKLSAGDLRRKRRDMQIIFQDPFSSLNPRMTVGAIIAEPFLIHKIARGAELERRVKDLLQVVGLGAEAADRYPHEFSGGQRQRIGIARAIALNPKLIVADEPVSALDVSIQSQILNLLVDLRSKFNLTYLFIAHDLAVIEHISDIVAVMYLGRIVEYARGEDIYARPTHPYTKALISAIPQPIVDKPVDRSARQVLSGDVPSPINPPSGCHFHPRCPLATDRCKTEAPLPRNLGAASSPHLVACHNV
jgi:oligopeptide transport system ATP-binding protein